MDEQGYYPSYAKKEKSSSKQLSSLVVPQYGTLQKQRNHVLSMLHASKQAFFDKLGSADVRVLEIN